MNVTHTNKFSIVQLFSKQGYWKDKFSWKFVCVCPLIHFKVRFTLFILQSSQITLKLVLAYGVSELVGFVQLPSDNQESQLVNSTFSLLYHLLRSLRGVVIFIIYVCKRTVLERFRDMIRPSRNVNEIVRCGEVALSVVVAENHRIPSHSRWNQDHFDAEGKINSEDTTNTSFHNQACNINDEGQENSRQLEKKNTTVIYI